jgi:SagB-type dehydrogenase family enzyme
MTADPIATRILHFFTTWRSVKALETSLPEYSGRSIRRAAAALERRAFLIRRAARGDNAHPMESWSDWNPAAGFFHLSTKDVRYANEPIAEQVGAASTQASPMPSPVKRYADSRRYRLPRVDRTGEYLDVLRARRTWRHFSRRPVDLRALSALLELTFGVQHWLEITGVGRVPLKTSPSGGARHSLEAYVLVRKTTGLRRGLYHYATDRHELELLRRYRRTPPVARYLPEQHWFNGAAVVIFMTAVFGRVQWRYQFPRAYRVVLAEAGHICQTFCLTATWLGLAPFCSMALADSVIEREIGIDGVTESVLYVAGVGTRSNGRGQNVFAGDTKTGTSGQRLVTVPAASASPSRRRRA